MNYRILLLSTSLFCILLLPGRLLRGQQEFPADLDRRAEQATFGGAKTQVIEATWEFSSDGGKTFAAALPVTYPANTGQSLLARATFKVEDPAAIACLWVTHDETKSGKSARGAFAMAAHEDVGGGECGATPSWTKIVVALNGKTPGGPLPGMMYHALPVDTTAGLLKGTNTLTISGPLAALKPAAQVAPKPLLLTAAVPGAAVIRNGPILGHFGDDFFTVACRTGLPAEVTVTATPLEPAAAATTVDSPRGFYHRLKVPLPKGTRKFSYTVASKLGDATSSKGPFEVSLPAADAKSLRVVTFGNSRGNYYSWCKAALYVEGMQKCKPDVFVHLGQVMEFPSYRGTSTGTSITWRNTPR